MKDYTLEKMLRAVQKPGRYIGCENGAVIKNKDDVKLRFAFCFPDNYEVGMSHLGLKILYYIMNKRKDIWCERVFAPWFDMREQMEKYDYPLFALESKDPLTDFDILGFTLQYEMSYTNILYMLELSKIPMWAKDRDESFPLIIAGGPCACNPEPIADFIDLFALGDGEELDLEICELVIKAKAKGWTKKKLLTEASKIKGVYVPSLYKPVYNKDGSIAEYKKRIKAVPDRIEKRLVLNLNDAEYPDNIPVPLIETIHDRANIEVLRGCVRGCRFCQAGFIYRPFRAKSAETLNAQARELCQSTGYDELSLISLSTSDHPQIEELLDKLLSWTPEEKINLSLPSLRVDSLSDELIEKISVVRKSGLTFAPEAGTQRLRDVINKNITEEEIMDGCKTAFEGGYTSVKLYFMLGLPTETDEDIVGIAELAQRIVNLYYSLPTKPKGKPVSVSVSCACFIPKPFTPFQFCAADIYEEFIRKQRLLRASVKSKKISVSTHEPTTSFIEAVLARGDRRLSKVIYDVYKDGGIFDSWDEGFSFERWLDALKKNKLSPEFYANRARTFDEINPWDILDYGISKEFLVKEYKKAIKAKTTPRCDMKCSSCGIAAMTGRKCFAKR
ncbi:MAG: TIGR03960 family B12-binding radical SAM protein [Ruminococcaceae bacterium]|nr:TIGR03960 family B12-binding radical SAM protein [Oscillospiraceae bacterium]